MRTPETSHVYLCALVRGLHEAERTFSNVKTLIWGRRFLKASAQAPEQPYGLSFRLPSRLCYRFKAVAIEMVLTSAAHGGAGRSIP